MDSIRQRDLEVSSEKVRKTIFSIVIRVKLVCECNSERTVKPVNSNYKKECIGGKYSFCQNLYQGWL